MRQATLGSHSKAPTPRYWKIMVYLTNMGNCKVKNPSVIFKKLKSKRLKIKSKRILVVEEAWNKCMI